MKHLSLLICIITSFAYVQQSPFNPEKSTGQLYEYAEFTNVKKAEFSVKDVHNNTNLIYNNLESENHDLGFTSDIYWLRFQLQNSSNDLKTYYLETARPITDIVTLYKIDDKVVETQTNGDQIPFKDRAVQHRQVVFKIELKPKTISQFYIKLSSDGEAINLPLNLYDETKFLATNYKQQLFLGIFYGMLLLAGLVYLFFYTSLKNEVFLYYSLYVFSIALMQAALDGFIHQYVLTDGGYLNSRIVMLSALFSNFFLLKYCEYFLEVEDRLPKFKKVYNTIYSVLAVLFICVFISPKVFELTYPISNLNGVLSLLLILITLFTIRFKKMHVDVFFSIGIFFLVIGLLGFVMNNLGVLPSNFYTLNSSKFGTGLEVIFLSLSMTNLLRNLKQEKERSQQIALENFEKISEMKTFFMSNISHELRTPINAIMGLTDIELANEETEKETHEKFQTIRNASISLLSSVNDILDFEKIEKNEIKLQKEIFNPSVVLRQISNNWRSEAHNKGLSYHFEMDTEIPLSIKADEERLLQILNNVLGNAVKFTNTGKVKVKLKCIKQPNNKSKFSFLISDTGIGMTAEEIQGVFDSFNQMQKNHKRQFGGIGLGLSIAKHLTSLFGGNIKIESILEKGTNVYIEIPVELASTKVSIENKDIAFKKPLHILVVEDNKLNQIVMKKLLKDLPSTEFLIVENGVEAIESLKENVYDLILMDLQMPIMDGYEATQIIKSGKLGNVIKSIPIIAVTADAMDETKKRALSLGMHDYLTKPVKRDVLFQKIAFYT